MAIEPAIRATPALAERARRPDWGASRRQRLRSVTLRLRAWWLGRSSPGEHPVADLIAAGNWRALDELLDDLASAPTPAHWEDERRHGT